MKITFNDYKVTKEIYKSARSLILNAISNKDNHPYIIKILNKENPTQDEIARLKQEYNIISMIKSPNVIKAFDYIPYHNTVAAFLEDINGQNLSHLIPKFKSLDTFFDLAIKIIQGLDDIHKIGIIHKDINPQNIIYNSKTKELRIIDFGIAAKYAKNPQNISSEENNKVEGTILYISPEQTGRMNRQIDYRSDYYSLGIVLYELLTKKVPFVANDSLEVIHAHITKEPPSIRKFRPDIHPMLEKIILKLLAKNADDRYQSANGLVKDLTICKNNINNLKYTFELGINDYSPSLNIPQKLFGREKEINLLEKHFNNMRAGKNILTLVCGSTGIGKTSLINEIYRKRSTENIFFLTGTFNPYQNKQPYSAFLEAFQQLINQVLLEDTESIYKWKKLILKAIGENGQLIINLIPEVENIIGSQPPVYEVSPAEAKNRFNLILERFIYVFASEKKPLVLFFDNLQYADPSSLNLLNLLLLDNYNKYIFIIGAYRDNELKDTHPLTKFISEIKASSGIINILKLNPFSIKDLLEFLSETFKAKFEDVNKLSEIIFAKTNGNPAFILDFINNAYEQDLIYFNPKDLKWKWDEEKLMRTEICENVLNSLINKFNKVPADILLCLQTASCIGNTFDFVTLLKTLNVNKNDLIHCLEKAVDLGYLNSYNKLSILDLIKNYNGDIEKFKPMPSFFFIHSNLCQIAYNSLSLEERTFIHYKIGVLLEKNIKINPENIFETTNHLNKTLKIIKDKKELFNLIELNFTAGNLALKNFAYDIALNHLRTAESIIANFDWKEEPKLFFQVYSSLLEVEYINGGTSRTEELFNFLFKKAANIPDKIKLYHYKINLLLSLGKYQEIVKTGFAVFKLFKIKIKPKVSKFSILIEMIKTKLYLMNKPTNYLASGLPNMKDDNLLAFADFINLLYRPIMIVNKDLFAFVSLKTLNLTLKHGYNQATPFACFAYALLHLLIFKNFKKGLHYANLSLDLVKKNPLDKKHLQISYYFHIMFHYFQAPYNQIAKELEIIVDKLLANGYLEESIIAACVLTAYWPNTTESLDDLYAFLAKTREKQAKTIYPVIHAYFALYQKYCLDLKNEENSDLNEKHLENVVFKSQAGVAPFLYCLLKIEYFIFFNKYEKAFQWCKKAAKYIQDIKLFPSYYEFIFLKTLVLINIKNNPKHKGINFIKEIRNNFSILEKINKYNPHHFSARILLLKAELNKSNQEHLGLINLYSEAVDKFRANHETKYSALSYELLARFFHSINLDLLSRTYFNEAKYLYLRWGAIAKIQDILENYGEIISTSQLTHQPTLISSSLTHSKSSSISSSSSTSTYFDVLSILKLSQAISQEIGLKNLLEKLITIIIENTSSESGALILKDADSQDFFIEAYKDINSTEYDILESLSIEENMYLCSNIVKLVERSLTPIILAEAYKHKEYENNTYIKQNKCKSIMCFPIVFKNELFGIIYLENNISAGIYTEKKKEYIRILSMQVAIYIENAILYNHLEEQVKNRTDELSQANEELIRVKEDAEKANRIKSIFLAQMTHDLRTPLHVIIGSLDKYLNEKNKNKSYEDLNCISIALKSGERQLSLVNDILDLSKIEAGKIQMNFQGFELNSLFSSLHAQMNTLLDKKKNIKFTIENQLEKEHIIIKADKFRIAQIITNLLSNATKFTEKGKICLRVSRMETNLVFKISDTGLGINKENCDRLFERYAQIDLSAPEKYAGTGLGLVICKGFVQAHNGDISVESELGKGSTFSFWIPLVLGKSALTPRPPLPEGEGENIDYKKLIKKDILLCDDDSFNLHFADMVFKDKFNYLLVKSGPEAIAAIKNKKFDLIFMDLNMPQMDGRQVYLEIRKIEKATPIVALTADAMKGTEEQLRYFGFDDYISKPFKEKQIISYIAKKLNCLL
ncbi:AAA family ATPase [Candidatus Margulisiibacteriota bacterium]